MGSDIWCSLRLLGLSYVEIPSQFPLPPVVLASAPTKLLQNATTATRCLQERSLMDTRTASSPSQELTQMKRCRNPVQDRKLLPGGHQGQWKLQSPPLRMISLKVCYVFSCLMWIWYSVVWCEYDIQLFGVNMIFSCLVWIWYSVVWCEYHIQLFGVNIIFIEHAFDRNSTISHSIFISEEKSNNW